MTLYRVTLVGVVNGNTFNNVLHVASNAPPENTEAALAAYMVPNWIDKVKAFQNNQTQYLVVNVRSLENLAPAPFNLDINIIGTGGPTVAGDNPFTCAVLRLQTNVAGRTGRGRYHMPGVRLTTSANLGVLTAATLTAWQPNLNAMMASFDVGAVNAPWRLMVTSRGSPLQAQKAVTNLSFRAVLGTMRSRNYGVGN